MAHRIVISQSMYFPWVGFLEQLKLADIFVRYDDVQFSKGSFTNRVQIKTASDRKWLTVPLKKFKLGTSIHNVEIDDSQDWRNRQMEMLYLAYRDAPYFSDMKAVVQLVFSQSHTAISDLAFSSQQALLAYFGINPNLKTVDIRRMGISGSSSQRVLDVVRELRGEQYITGHGAYRYLDHEMLDQAGIDIQYMQYEKLAYPQQHGMFIPYVSALDLIANCGKDGADYIRSSTCNWRKFSHEPT